MGVWPGLDERPRIAHTARDWLAKLHLVAAGCGITTVPDALASAIPPGVRILPVRGGPAEQRRILLARVPRPLPEPVARLAAALRAAAIDTDTPASAAVRTSREPAGTPPVSTVGQLDAGSAPAAGLDDGRWPC
jgi:hypothetical protein